MLGAILGIGSLLLSGCSSASPSQPTQMPSMALADMPDYVQSAAASVQEAYQFAITNPHALETVPCYCGCGKMGHKNNLDCYVTSTAGNGKITFDNHAAYCGVCSDITHDVMRLQQAEITPTKIRAYIDAQYSAYGPPTDTALPVE